MEHNKEALSQTARDKHNSTFDPQYKRQGSTSTWQLCVWLHPKKQSKKILPNPAKLAPLLQKTGIVYMPPPLLPAASERTVLADSSVSEIDSDTFVNMNKQQYWLKGNSCLPHHRQQGYSYTEINSSVSAFYLQDQGGVWVPL